MAPRDRVIPIAGATATATLALLGAAWAATGRLPLAGSAARAPIVVSAQATGPLVANDLDGQAILTAGALRPGQQVTGEVTIGNAGDAPGAFTLSSGGVTDGPAGLSRVLDLSVRDLSTGTNVYTGKLGAFAAVPLGTFAAGAQRRYRFELAYPAGRAAAADNLLQGATTSVAFAWDAVATGGAKPNPTPPPAPAPVVPSAPAPAAKAPVPAAPATTATPAPAAPAPPAARAPAALTVALGAAAKPVAKGRLVTWMSSSTAATARVTGTVSFAGGRAKLPATSVRLTAKRRTVRLKLPAAAVRPGAKRRLTVRLTIAATAGGRRTTVKRTLPVLAP